jgi:hypothetical protein
VKFSAVVSYVADRPTALNVIWYVRKSTNAVPSVFVDAESQLAVSDGESKAVSRFVGGRGTDALSMVVVVVGEVVGAVVGSGGEVGIEAPARVFPPVVEVVLPTPAPGDAGGAATSPPERRLPTG